MLAVDDSLEICFDETQSPSTEKVLQYWGTSKLEKIGDE